MGSFMKLSLEAPHPHSKNLCSQVRRRLLTPHSRLARESSCGWVAVDGFSLAFFSLPQVGIVDIAVDGELDLETSTRVLKAGQEGLNFMMLTHGIDLDEDFINSEAKMEGMGADAVKLVRSHASRQESVIQFQFNSIHLSSIPTPIRPCAPLLSLFPILFPLSSLLCSCFFFPLLHRPSFPHPALPHSLCRSKDAKGAPPLTFWTLHRELKPRTQTLNLLNPPSGAQA